MAFLFAARPRIHWVSALFDFADGRRPAPPNEGFRGFAEGFDALTAFGQTPQLQVKPCLVRLGGEFWPADMGDAKVHNRLARMPLVQGRAVLLDTLAQPVDAQHALLLEALDGNEMHLCSHAST